MSKEFKLLVDLAATAYTMRVGVDYSQEPIGEEKISLSATVDQVFGLLESADEATIREWAFELLMLYIGSVEAQSHHEGKDVFTILDTFSDMSEIIGLEMEND